MWAIGTGKTPTPEQISQTHKQIENYIQDRFTGFTNTPKVLYGGSVKPGNAEALISAPFVSGLLVGGASIQADSFWEIISIASASCKQAA